MAGQALWRDPWLATWRRQPVRLCSPLPCDECLYRLRRVTSKRHGSRYLAERFAVGPGPVLYGRIEDEKIVAVSLWSDVIGRQHHRYAAQITAVAGPASGGGTTVTGSIAVRKSLLVVRAGFVVMMCCIILFGAASFSVEGRYQAIFGIIVLALFAAGEFYAPQQYERSAAALLEATATLLEASRAADTAPEFPSTA